MKKIIFFFLLMTSVAYATNLRGLVQKCNPNYGCMASGNSKVQIYYWNGYQWLPGAYTFTGNDGYYYFYDVYPGNYYLCVNNNFWYQINVVPLQWQDISVLSYNFY